MPSDPTNPGSCLACRLRRAECVCAHAPRLGILTRLIVIIHSKEWRKTTNTGHFARLAIQNAEVRLHGSPHQTVSSAGIESASASTLVLFPGRGASPLNHDYIAALPRPLTLLVPDGNWNQAKHMMRRVPMLCLARPVRLAGPGLDLHGLRHNSCPRSHVHLRSDRASARHTGGRGDGRPSATILSAGPGAHGAQLTALGKADGARSRSSDGRLTFNSSALMVE